MDGLMVSAVNTPSRVFLRQGRTTLTFAEADSIVSNLSAHIGKIVAPGALVVSLIDTGSDAALIMLAAHRAAVAVAFLDPSASEEVLSKTLLAVGPSLLIVGRENEGQLLGSSAPLLSLERPIRVELPASGMPSVESLGFDVHGSLVVFSSGTTGEPKGVVRSVSNLVANAQGQVERLVLRSGDCSGESASFRFITPATSVYSALASGSSVAFSPSGETLSTMHEPGRWLAEDEVSVVRVQTAVARSLIERRVQLTHTSLRMFTIAGESIFGEELLRLRPTLPPQCAIRVTYGSTEGGTIGHRNIGPDDPIRGGLVRFPAASCFIADGELCEVAPGEVGEIVSTTAMAVGYWRRPELTSAGFVSGADGRPLFRTGDLGRFVHGELEVLGRVDSRVKIRGFNVDLVEVEAALMDHPEVRRAVVVDVDRPGGGRSLIAYVVPGVGCLPSVKVLREFLSPQIASYKIPSRFVLVDRIETTDAGKVDRAALRAMPMPAFNDGETVVAPRSPVEQAIHDRVASMLGLSQLSCDDDLFDAGTDSLTAIELSQWLRDSFGLEASAVTIAAYPTISSLANVVSAPGARRADGLSQPSRRIGLLRPASRGTPFGTAVLVAGAGDSMLAMRPLARALPTDYQVFGVQGLGIDDDPGKSVDRSVSEYAQRVLDELLPSLKTASGPLLVCGHSFGGVAAHEVTRHLETAGVPVALLALLDTAAPKPPEHVDCLRRLKRCFLANRHDTEAIRALMQRADSGERDYRDVLRDKKGVAFDRQVRLLRSHDALPCGAPVLLLRARHESQVRDEHLGRWASLTSGGFSVRVVNGTHTAIKSDPFVREVASAIGEVVQKTPVSATEGPYRVC
jgi:acyl-coenzyme A synthetase/AMP-(fatty) acid ligase/thioesterase domain-containing protein/aryl carrier-like protein